MFLDALENPLEVAFENLPRLAVRYAIKKNQIKKHLEEKMEDTAAINAGVIPEWRDKSGDMIQEFIGCGSYINLACDTSLQKTKLIIPMIKTYENTVQFKRNVKDEVINKYNKKLGDLQVSDSKTKNKIGEILTGLSEWFY